MLAVEPSRLAGLDFVSHFSRRRTVTIVEARMQASALVQMNGVDLAKQIVQNTLDAWRERLAHANHHNLPVAYQSAMEEIEYWLAVLVAIDALESSGAV